jgi:hypothetical protein
MTRLEHVCRARDIDGVLVLLAGLEKLRLVKGGRGIDRRIPSA